MTISERVNQQKTLRKKNKITNFQYLSLGPAPSQDVHNTSYTMENNQVYLGSNLEPYAYHY